SFDTGVGQPDTSSFIFTRLQLLPASLFPFLAGDNEVRVGHEVQSLSDVRRTEARRAEIDTPDGVSRCFQVSRNSAEPSKAVFTANLFTKDVSRRTLPDEVIKRGP